MATIKSRKITKIVREFIKAGDSYDITGINLGLAKYLWRETQETFIDLATGDYRIDQSNGKQTLVIVNQELLGKAEAFQVGYVLDFTASPYDTEWNVDINQLKDKYNTLVNNMQSLWEYIRITGMIADDSTIDLILPQLDVDQIWVRGPQGYYALGISDFRDIAGEALSDYIAIEKKNINQINKDTVNSLTAFKENTIKDITNFVGRLETAVTTGTLELRELVDALKLEVTNYINLLLTDTDTKLDLIRAEIAKVPAKIVEIQAEGATQKTAVKTTGSLQVEKVNQEGNNMITQIQGVTQKSLEDIGALEGEIVGTGHKVIANLEEYLVNAENGGNAEYLQGYVPSNFDKVEGTIASLQASRKYKLGEVVEVLGYYTAGDGAGHKRKIEATDDGSGVQLANGLWANIVHSGEVNVSWFGAKGDGFVNKAELYLTKLDECKNITIDGCGFIFENNTKKHYYFNVKNCTFKNFVINTKKDIRLRFYNEGNLKLDNITLDGTGGIFEYTGQNNFYTDYQGIAVYAKDGETERPENCDIVNCKVSNIISSSGIYVEYHKNVNICNNIVSNCRGILIPLEAKNDADGDGIYSRTCENILISNNIVKNDIPNTNIGRCGICLETSTENGRISFNTISGYDRNIHIEHVNRAIHINNNYTYNGRTAFIAWTIRSADVLVENNVFTNSNFDDSHINNNSGYKYYRGLIEHKGSNRLKDNEFDKYIFRNNRVENYISRKYPYTQYGNGDDYFLISQESNSWGTLQGNTFVQKVKKESWCSISFNDAPNRVFNILDNYIESYAFIGCSHVDTVRIINNTIHSVVSNFLSIECVIGEVIGNTMYCDIVGNQNNFISSKEQADRLIIKNNTLYNSYKKHGYWPNATTKDKIFEGNVFKFKQEYVNNDLKEPLHFIKEIPDDIHGENTVILGSETIVFRNDRTKVYPQALSSLNTPYYATKMQQEGVYEDFIQYMDDKTEYDRVQREQPEGVMMLPVIEEPQPSEKLLAFKEKYLG